MAADITLGFNMPELIVESIIRDGFQNVLADLTIIDRLFSQLTRSYNNTKYGQAEIDKIKALIAKPIAVVYDYGEVDSHNMSYSIMLGSDDEDKRRAHIGDFAEEKRELITDPIKLAALVRVPPFTATSYDPSTGIVRVPDIVDLSTAYKGLLFIDNAGAPHDLIGGIDNTPGNKMFVIGKNDDVDLGGPVEIKSFLDYEEFEVNQLTSDIKLVVGVHSKDALTTKYLYLLLKYFIFTRKFDMISRGLYVSSFNGSDFTRDATYQGDKVYTRFLTVSGKVDDRWRGDEVDLIDRVIIIGTPGDVEQDDPDDD